MRRVIHAPGHRGRAQPAYNELPAAFLIPLPTVKRLLAEQARRVFVAAAIKFADSRVTILCDGAEQWQFIVLSALDRFRALLIKRGPMCV